MPFLLSVWLLLLASLRSLSLQSALYREDITWMKSEEALSWKEVEQTHLWQRQYFYQLRRTSGKAAATSTPPHAPTTEQEREGDPQLLEPKEGVMRLWRRIQLYPPNARLPIGPLSITGPLAQRWQETFWRLITELYQDAPCVVAWLPYVDQEAFMVELVRELERIGRQRPQPGAWGLAQVRFNDPSTQQVWDEMVRGSDRYSMHYPSLLAYLWPVKCERAGAPLRVNLVYASAPIIRALGGKELAIRWSNVVLETKKSLLDPSENPQTWLLTKRSYVHLLREVLTQDDPLHEMIEVSPGPWRRVPALLLRDEGCYDRLLPQTMRLP